MGHLAGYTYRHITNSLKRLDFKFDRQVAGSHEIWFNEGRQVYTTTPRHHWRNSGKNRDTDSEASRNFNRRLFSSPLIPFIL